MHQGAKQTGTEGARLRPTRIAVVFAMMSTNLVLEAVEGIARLEKNES